MALFWLSALACSRRINDDHTTLFGTNSNSPLSSTEHQDSLSVRSYGFKEPDYDLPTEFKFHLPNVRQPSTASSKLVEHNVREPEIDDYSEPDQLQEQPDDPEKIDSFESLNNDLKKQNVPKTEEDDFEHVRKLKEVSIISLKPKERNKAIDPITDQQGHAPMRVIRPMRDLSIIVRNRKHPVIISQYLPYLPRPHNRYYPHKPMLPKHKPCKPCKPKVHKKHHHKPKKPKKKPKKEHCHHHHGHKPPKKHPKKLIYYAPMPTVMNSFYGNRMPSKIIIPTGNNYEVDENPEHEETDTDTEKPFHQEVEDDVEEHRLGELNEPFDDDDPAESTLKVFKKL